MAGKRQISKTFSLYNKDVFVGIQMLDGTKVFGNIQDYDNYVILIDDGFTIVDVPRDYIRRIFAVVK